MKIYRSISNHVHLSQITNVQYLLTYSFYLVVCVTFVVSVVGPDVTAV